MAKETKLGGTFTLSDPTMNVYRMGYGAMQTCRPAGVRTAKRCRYRNRGRA